MADPWDSDSPPSPPTSPHNYSGDCSSSSSLSDTSSAPVTKKQRKSSERRQAPKLMSDSSSSSPGPTRSSGDERTRVPIPSHLGEGGLGVTYKLFPTSAGSVSGGMGVKRRRSGHSDTQVVPEVVSQGEPVREDQPQVLRAEIEKLREENKKLTTELDRTKRERATDRKDFEKLAAMVHQLVAEVDSLKKERDVERDPHSAEKEELLAERDRLAEVNKKSRIAERDHDPQPVSWRSTLPRAKRQRPQSAGVVYRSNQPAPAPMRKRLLPLAPTAELPVKHHRARSCTDDIKFM